MTGSFRKAWTYTPADLWEPLAAHTGKALSGSDVAAPDDLFIDLFAAADDFFGVSTPDAVFEECRNDPAAARTRFLAINGTDFASESDLVFFLEEARDVIADYEVPGFEDCYKRLLRGFLHKYNLRYRLDENPGGEIVLRFLLPGSFTNLYAELQRLNAGNPHLTALLRDFEEAFDAYVRKQSESNVKTCIAKASNYAEGLASATHGTPGTLGALCNQIGDWPHDKMKESLQHLYKFCSDYPGIRHAGTATSAKRALASRDSSLASLLLLSFSGYLSPQLDEHPVLGV